MKFLYEAADEGGSTVSGEIEAPGKAEVVRHLEAKNLIPIKVESLDEAAQGAKFSLSLNLFERVTPLDKIMMIRNLSAAIKAGLSIIEALNIMIADTNKKTLKNILIKAKSNLENGQPLWRTFESYGNLFPIIFVGMVKAGESSGELEETLDELSEHMAREYSLTKKVKAALVYPILLLSAAVGVVVLLIIFVLPKLSTTFETSGAELPLVTRVLVGISNLVTGNVVFDVIVVTFLVWFFLIFRRTNAGRKFFAWLFFKTPLVRELIKKVALVRFTRTLASLLRSGTPMLDALNLSADSVSNVAYKEVIIKAVGRVKSGIPLSQSLEEHSELFPRLLVGLMGVGEKTGTLDHTLRTFANFYDEEIDNSLKNLVSLLEPILVLGMGLLVALIAVSVLLPIYRLAGGFL